MILETYLDAFADACRRAGGWYGLDLFAGPGLNWSETRNEERKGSPIIALEAGSPKAIEIIAAESYGKSYEALCRRTEGYGDRIRLFKGDANRVVGDMLASVPPRAPVFAFLDPEGSELDWKTVETVADHKRGHSLTKIEQLILFPTDTGFVRLAPEHPTLVTRIFGHDDWCGIYERRLANELSADEARGEYVRLYANGLRKLGYKTDKPPVLDADPHPYVFRPGKGLGEFNKSLGSLGKNLEGVPVCRLHRREDAADEIGGDALMKEIAHRVDEDHPRPLPAKWLIKPFGPRSEIESLLIRMVRYAAKLEPMSIRTEVRISSRQSCACLDSG